MLALIYPLRKFLICCSLLFISLSLTAQTKELGDLKEALANWQSVSQNIQIQDLVNKKSQDSSRFMSATVVAFGQATKLEVEFNDGKHRRLTRLYISFPPAAKLSTEHFRAIFDKDFNSVMPKGVDAAIIFKEFEITFDGSNKNRIESAMINLQFGSWAPLDGTDAVTINDFSGKFSLSGISKGQKKFEVSIDSYLLIPENVAKYIGIGQTKLKSKGYINTDTRTFLISADLASQGIPIVSDKSVLLIGAFINLEVKNGLPKIFLTGQMAIEKNGKKLMPNLNGLVSIDIKGAVYGEAWLTQEEWNNPFGLNPRLSIIQFGFGFGVNFATTPIPTPMLAMEGGIIVKGADNQKRFDGRATIGVDLGDPTRNMIDADIDKLYVSDLIDAFAPKGSASAFLQELRKIQMSAVHMTIVPPGPGVKLFDREYKPGFMARGAFDYSGIRGAMYLQSNEEGLEAFGGLTPISFPGFSFTGTKAGSGPSMFLVLKPAASNVAFALNGNIKVLDVSNKADVYMSDAGFNLELDGNVFNTFHTKLIVAGRDIIKGDGVYVKATMQDDDNLVQKISKEASQEINRVANEVQANYNKATKQLESLRPQLQTADANLKRKQEEVRVKWQKWCDLLNQRAAQDQERIQLEQKVTALKNQINQMESKLANDRYSKAKMLNPTTCSGDSKAYEGYCYSPKAGYKWDINFTLAPTNGKATFMPEQRENAKPIVQGTFNVLAGGCPSGQWGDALTGKCYTCPPGYQKDGAATNCVKITPIQYAPAERGQYIGCGSGSSFADIGTGKCWECPPGYERKASLNAITTDKACELIDLAGREGAIRDKRVELAGIETQLTVITKGIGELATQLTGVGTDVCNKIKNTDAINADPEVAPLFTTWSGLSLQVNEFQGIVKTVGDTQVGALRAAAWVVENGGNALGVVDIDNAEFEGCLSTTQSGMVALKVKGKFAGNPLDASLKIDLKSPEQFIKEFAGILMASPNPKTNYSNGTCTRPNVPRPQINSATIEELMKFVNEGKPIELQQRPKREETPAWAAEKRL